MATGLRCRHTQTDHANPAADLPPPVSAMWAGADSKTVFPAPRSTIYFFVACEDTAVASPIEAWLVRAESGTVRPQMLALSTRIRHLTVRPGPVKSVPFHPEIDNGGILRVLVTGSCGFLGSAIVRHLRALGIPTVTADRPGSESPDPEHLTVDLEKGDGPLDSALPLDAVVHAAAVMPHSGGEEDVLIRNQSMAVNLAKWVSGHGIGQLVFLSGCIVYGNPPAGEPVSEESVPAPGSLYGVSKIACEMIFDSVTRPGTHVCHLRIPAPFGPGQHVQTVITRFMRQALFGDSIQVMGTGSRVQDFVHESDVGRAVLLALSRRARGPVNITGEAITMRGLAELCREISGRAVEIVFSGEDPQEEFRGIYSSAKARLELNYRPELSLRDALRDLARTMSR